MNWKCLFGHKWNGCKCEKCGETRDEGHNYLAVDGKCIEKCSTCGKERKAHKWNVCKCLRCGEINDAMHKWKSAIGEDFERCYVCGKVQAKCRFFNGSKCIAQKGVLNNCPSNPKVYETCPVYLYTTTGDIRHVL